MGLVELWLDSLMVLRYVLDGGRYFVAQALCLVAVLRVLVDILKRAGDVRAGSTSALF